MGLREPWALLRVPLIAAGEYRASSVPSFTPCAPLLSHVTVTMALPIVLLRHLISRWLCVPIPPFCTWSWSTFPGLSEAYKGGSLPGHQQEAERGLWPQRAWLQHCSPASWAQTRTSDLERHLPPWQWAAWDGP